MFRISVNVDRTRAYSRLILSGILRYAKINGPWKFYGQPRHFVAPLPELSTWVGDGAIIMVATPDLVQQARNAKYPVVNVSAMFESLPLPTVVPDNIDVGRLAAQHLLDRGFRRFAFYGPVDHGYARQRNEGFAGTVQARGMKCLRYVPGVDARSWAELCAGSARWLNGLETPIGIMAANDEFAMQLLESLHETKLTAPDDVAVIGADNDALAGELAIPSLSSVDVNAFEVGFQAAAMLHRLMKGGRPPLGPHLVKPVGIASRKSTDVLASEDALMRSAMAFIRSSFREGIGVDHVADQVRCSRRALELRFKEHLKRSPADEIRRVRVEAAQQLLLETDLSLDDVAARTGLSTQRQMGIVFSKQIGIAPSEFRRQHRRPGAN